MVITMANTASVKACIRDIFNSEKNIIFFFISGGLI
jgi:hypothetical protein